LCALQPRRNWWCWQRSWSARWSRHEVGGRTIAGGDHCGSGRGGLQRTDVIWRVPYVQHSSPKALRGDLTSAVSWARRYRHSKVLVMIEDEQRSLGALKPVAAILYLPDADAVWFCFVHHH
jgi:hypothetical protein